MNPTDRPADTTVVHAQNNARLAAAAAAKRRNTRRMRGVYAPPAQPRTATVQDNDDD